MKTFAIIIFLFCFIHHGVPLIPPTFQWRLMNFAWDADYKNIALASGGYVPENIMPTGIARWNDKLFIAIPRWKKGVPASLNYVPLNGTQNEPLRPYPNWQDAFVLDDAQVVNSNATVVSAFRVHVDCCNRLWVVDNGVSDMSENKRQISSPAVVVFDLTTDTVVRRFDLTSDVLRENSVFTSVVADIVAKDCNNAYAYITDMGSNGVIVYSLKKDEAWRVEDEHFKFDPAAGAYKVGGIHFKGEDGVVAAALAHVKKDGFRDLYFHPMSSTKQLKINTKLLREKGIPKEEIEQGVLLVGERGPFSQSSACDFDPKTNVLFFTQICKNGVACWNIDKPFTPENTPTIASDCNLLEYPNDVKIDNEHNLWVLSNRQARFLHSRLDTGQVNFRVMHAPVELLLQGSTCEHHSGRASTLLGNFWGRNKSANKQHEDNKKQPKDNKKQPKDNKKQQEDSKSSKNNDAAPS